MAVIVYGGSLALTGLTLALIWVSPRVVFAWSTATWTLMPGLLALKNPPVGPSSGRSSKRAAAAAPSGISATETVQV